MTDKEKPLYEKPESAPASGQPLDDEQADAVVGGGSGAAGCYGPGSTAFNECQEGSCASC